MSAKFAAASSEESLDRRAIVVLGMHRSGTSAMARTLSLLGAALPKRLTEARYDNEKGFWEPWKVALLNDEILEAVDSEWDDVFAFRPKQYLSNFDRVYLGRAVELLEEEFNGSELIVLKDPRISVLTPFWDRALREAGYATHYVIMVRNPLEVAESLRARDGFPREKSLLLWSSYMIAIDRDTRNVARTFVSYDQLMGDWRGVRRRIEAGARVPFPRDTSTAAIEIDRFLDPRLQHHATASNDLFSSADVPEQVKTLYRIFSGACEGAEVDAAALEGVRAEMEELDLLVGPLLADLRGSTRALSAKVSELTSDSDQARGQAAGLQEELLAERTLREADRAAAFQSSADYQARIAELAEKLSAVEAERDRLAAEVEDKARSASELGARLAAMGDERDRLAAEVEEKGRSASELVERFATVEAERDRLVGEVEAKARIASEQSDRLASLEAERGRLAVELEREAESASKFAKAVAKAESERESMRDELARLRNTAEAEGELLKQLASAQARYLEVEGRLTAAEQRGNHLEQRLKSHFGETAALSKMLLEREENARKEAAKVQRLREIHQAVTRNSRWSGLLPRSRKRERENERLRRLGLFDADRYLRMNPDVAESGMDPLEHFVLHGIDENRQH